MSPKTPLLDSITANLSDSNARTRAQLAATAAPKFCDCGDALVENRCVNEHCLAAAAGRVQKSLVPGETDPTTFRALVELYDASRDKAIAGLAALTKSYGEELQKRDVSSAIAAPLLAEMRKALDRADAAQARSVAHGRSMHGALDRLGRE